MKRVSDNILLRVYVLFGLFLVFAGVIMLRVMGLQFNKAYWVQQELEEKVYFHKVVADRGNILAEDGSIMAASLPFYRLAMDPTIIDTTAVPGIRDSVFVLASNLATYFGEWVEDSVQVTDSTWEYFERKDTLLYYNRILHAMRTGDRHIYLTRKKVNFKELQMVKRWPILNWSRYKGGFIPEKLNNERFYPYHSLAKATLGTIVQDTQPVRGIEYSFHPYLRGKDSYVLTQKIVGGGELPLNQYGESNAIDGMDVVTTLDVNLQDIVEKALAYGVERSQAASGTAILMEVKTGKIKALANFPETYNHGIATQLEPGSTFKLVSATAALEDEIIDICDTVDTGDGVVDYAEQQITDNGRAYGAIDFEHIFALSSNVGVSLIINEGYKHQPMRYLRHLRKFGFFEPANKQIIGEPKPIIYQPGDSLWNSTTLPSMAIGYSVHVTPLQMATFYNAIANKGKMMRPWLVKEVRDNSRVVEQYGPELMQERICSPETIAKLSVLLKAVVTYGTAARALKGISVPVAGKTGTARKFKFGEYRNVYRASFGGFFPANEPKYTCYIMVDEPKAGGIGGGAIAAPIFRQIVEQVSVLETDLLDPQPELKDSSQQLPAPRIMYAQSARELFAQIGISTDEMPDTTWVEVKKDSGAIHFAKIEQPPAVVPDLRGMSARDAMVLLENMGLRVRISGRGVVRRQSLMPGYKVGKGSLKAITLFLG
ncbi:MAG: PASTA domain-containing protein [Bacteroidetes bacterium]|nr:MAG: PASTA domain-containing protein [Bacteroidota bacterium]